MTLAWLGALLFASAWVVTTGLMGAPLLWLGAVLFAAGAACYVVGLRGAVRLTWSTRPWAALATCGLLAILLPWPARVPPILLAMAIASAWAETRTGRPRYAGGLLLATLASAAIAIALPVTTRLWVLSHSLPWMGKPMALLARCAGVAADAHGDYLVLGGFDTPLQVALSPERFGLPFVVCLVAVGLLHACVTGLAWWRLVGVVGAVSLWSALWMLLVALADLPQADGGALGAASSPLWATAGYVPPVLLLGRLQGTPPEGACTLHWEGLPIRRGAITASLAFVAVAALTLCGSYPDAGIAKSGRVVIDEAHSRWESTLRPMDCSWFGELSTYNFYNFAQHIGRYFQITGNVDRPLDDATLRGCDVLVLKTPTEAYTPEEVASVARFVRSGGGLWLIGDHTNVFGMGTYLNQIARAFGLRFNYDSEYELATGKLSLWRRPTFLPDPITGAVPEFLWATSCTLGGSPLVRQVMVGNGLKSIPHDYSQPTFFPSDDTLRLSQRETFGPFLQCGASLYGKGRVVAIADSTMFSNFFVYIAGRPELILGTVNWLNHSNAGWPVSRLAGIVGLVTLGLLLWPLRGPRRATLLAVAVAAGCLGYGVAGRVSTYTALERRPLPEPRVQPLPTVAFEMQYSSIALPLRHLVTQEEIWRDYLTFLVWSQRVGLVPSHHSTIASACRTGRSLVMINPQRKLSEQDAQVLREYVERGGVLLLMVGRGPAGAAQRQAAPAEGVEVEAVANDILRPWAMEVRMGPGVTQQDLRDTNGRRICATCCAGTVSGGEALALLPGGEAVVAERRAGRGKVIVLTDARLLAGPSMGSTNAQPSPAQLEVYDLAFRILRSLPGAQPAGSSGGSQQALRPASADTTTDDGRDALAAGPPAGGDGAAGVR